LQLFILNLGVVVLHLHPRIHVFLVGVVEFENHPQLLELCHLTLSYFVVDLLVVEFEQAFRVVFDPV